MTTISSISENYFSSLYQSNGIVRARSPQETLQIAEYVGKQIGITRLANVTYLDKLNIPVMLAIRANSRRLAVSQGKGATMELARISALMESIETWHAESLPSGDCHENYALQKACEFLQPSSVAQSFYDTRILDRSILSWHQGYELIQNHPIFIPTHALSLNSATRTKVQLLFGASSNGLASGNTLAEALCSGILEVIERDAYVYFQEQNLEFQKAQSIDLKTIQDPLIIRLLTQCEQAETKVVLYDVTDRHGIPSIICTLNDRDFTRRTNHFMGMGTHYLKHVAVLRALTEAAQVRLTYITGSRDDVFPGFYTHTQTPLAVVPGQKDYQKIPELVQKENFELQVAYLLAHLVQKGITQVAYYNHTRPEFNLSVVHVFIPGMRRAV